MNYTKALEILDIQLYVKECKGAPYTLKYLKHKYHKLALQNHPDKNDNSAESNEKFKQINEAYEFLKKGAYDFSEFSENIYDDEQDGNTCYQNILKTFIFDVMKGSYNTIISSIVQEIVSNCKNISLKMFTELNKDTSIHVYSFLSKYKHVLHISDEILSQMKDFVLEKCKDDQVYILNPNIDDLLGENVYKLEINSEFYYVPLWHDEVYFDGKTGCEIIVKCIPDLPENISIDEDNNLIIELQIPFRLSLLDDFYYTFTLGKQIYNIDLRNLSIQKIQRVFWKDCGVTKINEMDVYDVSKKGDMLLKIVFV